MKFPQFQRLFPLIFLVLDVCAFSCITVSHCLTDRWKQCSGQPGSSLVEDDSASFIRVLGKLWAAKSPPHSTPSSWTSHEQKLNYCAKHLVFLEFTPYSTLANIQIFFYYFHNFIITIKIHWNFRRGSNMESYLFFFLRYMVSCTKTLY